MALTKDTLTIQVEVSQGPASYDPTIPKITKFTLFKKLSYMRTRVRWGERDFDPEESESVSGDDEDFSEGLENSWIGFGEYVGLIADDLHFRKKFGSNPNVFYKDISPFFHEAVHEDYDYFDDYNDFPTAEDMMNSPDI
ncbi:hypothetical protein IFR05_004231 [Cadophora sp. M221]|nr:hypothetical protein IFR05_004231 [Cadophora sp. M221]